MTTHPLTTLVDLVIAFALLEGVILVARHRLTGRGRSPSLLLPNLASGLCLLAALRVALGGGAGMWILACLAGSGLAHMLDMRSR